MTKLLIATHNKGKLLEIQALLHDINVELLTPSQISLNLEVNETGKTYTENAALKGVAFARASGLLTLADDSGLEVQALDGLPGIISARFAPMPDPTDADRRAYLLMRLQGKPRPWLARFRCVVAMVRPGHNSVSDPSVPDLRFTEGICPGEIIPTERGLNGFGYDPIFLLPKIGRTMAELTMEEKNRLSHRARALQAALPILIDMIRNFA
jgi:XTP/dITP diphosphohydrolase